ncbi:MAG: PocR ligand-binding domain-containing protein [Desulfobacteraceae bacterium]|jgi:ligand-binding sensor protein
MELLDLCPIETWKSLENEICARSGLTASVFNIEGIRIRPIEKWPNRLCPEIKANPKGQSFICATAHMNIAILAKTSKEPVIEECDAGLIKLVVPILVNDEFVGTVAGCGLLLDDGEVDTFLVNKITEIDEAHLESLAEDIPALSMAQAQALGQFIKEQVEQIVSDYQKRIK